MRCRYCNSSSFTIYEEKDTRLVRARRTCFWWIFIGWWWIPIKWLFFMLPALIFALFAPKRVKLVTTSRRYARCNQCGHSYKIK